MSAAPALLPLALDVSAIPARPAGAGRYVVELVRALSARSDVQLTLYARRDDGERWRQLSPASCVRAVAPSSRAARLAWGELGLGAALRRHPGAAVLHAPHYTLPAWPGLPCVVTVHDCTFLDHPEWHERSKALLFGRAIRQAARRASVVVCPSASTAQRFEELCSPTCPVVVVPHGVDHDRFGPEEPEAGSDDAHLARLGLEQPYLLHLGTIEPRKDVATLVRAFGQLAATPSRSDLRLVIAGLDGWGAAAADVAAARAELPPAVAARVTRLGWVEEEAKPALLRRSAAVVYASIEEGFGVPALEALACGAPLVTSRGSVMADLAGAAAELAAPGSPTELAEAIERGLADPAATRRRRDAGLRIAQAMTWEASAAGHVRAYRAASAGRASVA